MTERLPDTASVPSTLWAAALSRLVYMIGDEARAGSYLKA